MKSITKRGIERRKKLKNKLRLPQFQQQQVSIYSFSKKLDMIIELLTKIEKNTGSYV